MIAQMFEQLGLRLISAGVPFVGMSQDRIDYRDSATPEQRQQGDAILAAWDWDAEPVPLSCTNDQARLALIAFGILPEQVDAVIDVIEDPVRRTKLQTLWRHRQVFRRDNEDLQAMATALGIANRLDDLFRIAPTL